MVIHDGQRRSLRAASRGVRGLRSIIVVAVIAVSTLSFTPQVLAVDVNDIGFVDQSAIGQLPPFQAAQAEFAQYQRQLSGQFQRSIKGKSQADQQRIFNDFNGRAAAKQRELFGPLLNRAQTAIASVAANKGLSVVVDKSIIIFGGLDITKDVIDMINQPGAVVPPVNSPSPSEVGYVDQTQLDAVPKVKKANDDFLSYRQTLQTQLSSQMAGKSPDQRQQLATNANNQLNDEQKKVLQPIQDAISKAITDVAKKRGLLLVVDAPDRVYGGTDVTSDVVKALQ